MTLASAIARLSDPDPAVRDGAAAELRGKSAKELGDPGESFWKTKLASIKPGVTQAQLRALTGATAEAGIASGQTSTVTFRLDDYWTFVAYFDVPDTLREIGPLDRRARAIWVEPPKAFSGRWTTYFVNGVVAREMDYAQGAYRRVAEHYDNGQLAYEQTYAGGLIDGDEVGYHRDGKKAYEIHHAAGKSVGRWIHWYPNGNVQMERTYVNDVLEGPMTNWREDGTKSSRIDYRAGEETGQAAWDEHGKVLYARGTASNP
jgi:hypothetical protein